MMQYRGSTFGRVMSDKEYSTLSGTGMLIASNGNGLVPVFGCPPCIEQRLSSMSKKSLHDLFRQIGVREPGSTLVNHLFNLLLHPIY